MDTPRTTEGYLAGRTALVTGAGRGLGRAIGLRLAGLGAQMILGDVDAAILEDTAQTITRAGGRARTYRFDVADGDAVRRVFAESAPIEILVNNAGICPLTAVEAIGQDEWDRVMAVNLKGAFLCTQAALPGLRAAGWGRVINISSLAAQMGGLVAGLHYTVSKGGLLAMTKAFARMLAPYGVTVNAIAPGPTETDLTAAWPERTRQSLREQMARDHFMQPEEVAEAAAFLCSPLAGSITGATIDINAGLLMR
jgi:3-oxoacyl-[acyl-carrier protein] reductase